MLRKVDSGLEDLWISLCRGNGNYCLQPFSKVHLINFKFQLLHVFLEFPGKTVSPNEENITFPHITFDYFGPLDYDWKTDAKKWNKRRSKKMVANLTLQSQRLSRIDFKNSILIILYVCTFSETIRMQWGSEDIRVDGDWPMYNSQCS